MLLVKVKGQGGEFELGKRGTWNYSGGCPGGTRILTIDSRQGQGPLCENPGVCSVSRGL